MKIIIIILIFLFLLLITNVEIQIIKVNQNIFHTYLIIGKLLRIKIGLNKVIFKNMNNINININQNNIAKFKKYQPLIKNLIKQFDGEVIYFAVDSSSYVSNIGLYLTNIYIYSFLQNFLLINLRKIKKSCLKSKIKDIDFDLEIDIRISSKIYRLVYFLLSNLKKIRKVKNEQSSNNRIIKNING